MNIEIFAEFFGIAATYAIEFHCRKFRTAAQHDFQEGLVVLHTGKDNLYVFEKALCPQVVDGHRYLVARNLYHVTHLETCYQEHHALVEVVFVVNGDATNLVSFRGQIVNIIILANRHLCLSLKRRDEQEE